VSGGGRRRPSLPRHRVSDSSTTSWQPAAPPEPDDKAIDRPAELAPEHTADTVHCLRLPIDTPTDRWLIDRCHKKITAQFGGPIRVGRASMVGMLRDRV
jgi:hypothetical protein